MLTQRKLYGTAATLLVWLLLGAAGLPAQSLGELARQQKAARKAKAKRVYTNEDVSREVPAAPAAKPESGKGATKAVPTVPFVPSPEAVVERMLQLAEVKTGDVVYDLGCGDGRIVIMAAQKFGAKAVGVELDPAIYQRAADRVKELKLEDRVQIIHGDLLEVDVSPATVITLYLLPSMNAKVRPNLEKFLRPGSRVVSHDFEVPGWRPDKEEDVSEDEGRLHHNLYLYLR